MEGLSLILPNVITGKAYHCGDFVNTDVMSPGRFEPYGGVEELARIALIDYEGPTPFVDPASGRSPYTVIFAGKEFGCGSSRETAPQALHYAGARVVIARSFARIFYRNCVNMGLLLPIQVAHPYDNAVVGAEVEVDIARRTFRVGGGAATPFPDFGPVAEIIAAGGLTAFNKRRIQGGAR